MKRYLAGLLLIGLATPLLAVEEEFLPPPPPQVPYDGGQPNGQQTQPDIRIVEKEDAMITEYRVNGQLYAIKVQPKVGPAYYLYDDSGDGVLDRRRELGESPGVNYWRVFSW